LDGDDAGRVRREALLRELYSGYERAVLLLSEALSVPECETEDILGEKVLITHVSALIGKRITLSKDDRGKGGIVNQIASAVTRQGKSLPEGWKPEVARRVAVAWSSTKPEDIPQEVLDRAEILFKRINERFNLGVGIEP
jgi:hypothetical protein